MSLAYGPWSDCSYFQKYPLVGEDVSGVVCASDPRLSGLTLSPSRPASHPVGLGPQ